MLTTVKTLPNLLASIKRDAGAAVAALHKATNDVREVLGQTPLPTPEAAGPVPANALVSLVRVTMTHAAGAFAELRQAAEALAGVSPKPALPTPVPLVAPTLAGLPARTIVEQATLEQEAAMNARVAEAEQVEQHAEDEAYNAPLVAQELQAQAEDLERSPTDDAEANADKEVLEPGAPVNRIAPHLGNGHIEPGKELEAVGLGVESPEAGKRGGKRRPRKS